MSKKSNPETDDLYHQKIIEKYSKEEESAKKTAETVVKSNTQKSASTKKYLKELEKAQKEARDKEFRDLDFAHQMGYMKDSEYYAKLAKLRDKYFANGSADWQKYTLKINKYQVNMIEKQKEDIINLYDEISREAETAIKNVEKKYEGLKTKLSKSVPMATKYTATFVGQGPGMVLETGTWRNYEDYVVEEYRASDFKKETEKLNKIAKLFEAIKTKGVSNEFLNQFAELSTDDMLGTAEALVSMSDKDFNEFYSSWQNFKSATESTAYKLTQPDRDNIISEYGSLGDDLKQSLTDAFGTIPETFYEYGMLSAEEFGKGFASRVNSVQTYVSGSVSAPSGISGDGDTNSDTETVTETNNTYNFYGSDKTDGERLKDVMRFSEIMMMRGE